MPKAAPQYLDVDRGHIVETMRAVLDTLPSNAYRSLTLSWSLVEGSNLETITLAYTSGLHVAPDLAP